MILLKQFLLTLFHIKLLFYDRFKAFGAPKLKKKEEDESVKKDELLDNIHQNVNHQRRTSASGSSVSDSVSSFSQESSPSAMGRSPQQIQQLSNLTTSNLTIESQIHNAGFYQDALSTCNSPYNSPYYATPPRYSAQFPPTPSPQHHPLSPANHSNFEQTGVTVPPSRIYSQISPQLHNSNQETTTQKQSPTSASQKSPQSSYTQNSPRSESQQSQPLLKVSAHPEQVNYFLKIFCQSVLIIN